MTFEWSRNSAITERIPDHLNPLKNLRIMQTRR